MGLDLAGPAQRQLKNQLLIFVNHNWGPEQSNGISFFRDL